MKKIFFTRLASILAVTLVLFPIQVSALSDEQKRVLDSGIYYFNTSTGDCSASGAVAGGRQDARSGFSVPVPG